MKKLLLLPVLLIALFTNAQDCLLEQKPVQKLVQDYTGYLSGSEVQELEQALVAFNDSTSTQILVVLVDDLCGYDKAEFTYTLGEKWQVGQKGKDNGIVVMVKPKEIDGRGEVFIAPGYGLEGVLPDATAKKIVEYEMIPHFKQKDYYGGIVSAAITIMEITGGEYSAESYGKGKKGKKGKKWMPFVLAIFFIIIFIFTKARGARKYASTNGMTFWAAWSVMNAANRSHSGSWDSFSSGGGSFGGFGGGSFGGGGAGGSW